MTLMTQLANPLAKPSSEALVISETIALYILIDASGSMEGEKYKLVRDQLLNSFLPRIPPSAACGIISFGANIAPAVGTKVDAAEVFELLPITENNRSVADGLLRTIPSELNGGGGTPLFSAILYALQQLQKKPALRRSIVVFTDGEASDAQKLEEVRRLAIPLKLDSAFGGLMMFAVGLGVLPENLRQLAVDTGGSAEPIQVANGETAVAAFLQRVANEASERTAIAELTAKIFGMRQEISALSTSAVKSVQIDALSAALYQLAASVSKQAVEVDAIKLALLSARRLTLSWRMASTFLSIVTLSLVGYFYLKSDLDFAVIREQIRLLEAQLSR
jgi:von Willebrand factor type A domain